VRDQMERMWQDVVVAYLKHNPHSLVERFRKTIKSSNKDGQTSGP
jgi:hypothetical protein